MSSTLLAGGPEQALFSLVSVSGRTFRVFTPPETLGGGSADGERVFDDEMEAETPVAFDAIKKVYRLTMRVPKVFIGFLIGPGGSTRRRLEQETECKLLIPRRDDPSEQVVLQGPTEPAVRSLATRVELEMRTALDRLPPTHFLALPFTDEPWASAVRALQERCGLESALCTSVKRLHCTLVVLRLYTAQAQRRAVRALQDSLPRVYDALGTRTLAVQLRGLRTFEEPATAHVVYAVPNEQERITAVARVLRSAMQAAGLHATIPGDTLQPHITLFNTRYRAQSTEGESRVPFDARTLLREHGRTDLGAGRVPSVQLYCLAAAGDADEDGPCAAPAPDGAYRALASIPLP